jgi:hypothetical protein
VRSWATAPSLANSAGTASSAAHAAVKAFMGFLRLKCC